MTQEYLTPGDMSRYSINRMPDSPDIPGGNAGRPIRSQTTPDNPFNARGQNSGRPGVDAKAPNTRINPDTASKQDINAEFWRLRIAREKDPHAREALGAMMRSGAEFKVGGGAAELPPVTDPALQHVVIRVNTELLSKGGDGSVMDQEFIDNQLNRLDKLIDEGKVTNIREADQLRQDLYTMKREAVVAAEHDRTERDAKYESDRGLNYGISLKPEDIKVMRSEGAIGWLNNQFDIIYKNAAEGQELNSPVVQTIQGKISEAVGWVGTYEPENLLEFQTMETMRFNLMYMRAQIGLGDIDKIRGNAAQLGVRGLMYGFGMEEGKVGSMSHRMHELLEDERLKGNPEHHTTPAMVNRLQTRILEEQRALAQQGLSKFGDLSPAGLARFTAEFAASHPTATDEQKAEAVRKEQDRVEGLLVRSVRMANDVFISSQRLGVIVARGRRLTGGEAYFSDPASGPLNVYNLEDLLIEKFDLFNKEGTEFVERLKINMAEGSIRDRRGKAEKLKKDATGRTLTADEQKQVADAARELTVHEKAELGRRLFRDLFAVPDFFTSGWRIGAILNEIDERCIGKFEAEGKTPEEARRLGLELAKDFALFMRLKAPEARKDMTGSEKDDKKREVVLGRIAEIRPEEIVRLFRERIQDDHHTSGIESMHTRLQNLYSGMNSIDSDVKDYDSFKLKYGHLISTLRQNGLSEMRQIRFGKSEAEGGLTADDRRMIDEWKFKDKDGNPIPPTSAADIQRMFRLMEEFSKASVTDLATHDKFEDAYARTILIDDALLDKLEEPDLKKADGTVVKKDRFTPFSTQLSTDAKGDPMIRIWNDTKNAIEAGKSLIDFIKKEKAEDKIKAAEAFSDFTAEYNGQGARAKCFRYTAGTFLELSKTDLFWDLFGASKGPFRKAISDIERIYGPSANPISREELRVQLDHFKSYLVANLDKNYEEMTIEERAAEEKKVDLMYLELEKALEVTGKDTVKRRFFLIFLSAILGTVAESMDFAKKGAT